jgi:hypothetical protein
VKEELTTRGTLILRLGRELNLPPATQATKLRDVFFFSLSQLVEFIRASLKDMDCGQTNGMNLSSALTRLVNCGLLPLWHLQPWPHRSALAKTCGACQRVISLATVYEMVLMRHKRPFGTKHVRGCFPCQERKTQYLAQKYSNATEGRISRLISGHIHN